MKKITLECTDLTNEFLVDLFKHKVSIINVQPSPNGFVYMTLKGEFEELFHVYVEHWCEPQLGDYVSDFKDELFD